MDKDDPTTEDDLLEEYDLKILEVRKLGFERKIFNKITALFRLSINQGCFIHLKGFLCITR